MKKDYWEDCQPGERGTTAARTVTEADVVAFASLSGDWNAIHTDAEFARTTAIGERIAHGFLVLSISSGLRWQGGQDVMPRSTLALVGVEAVRFLLPVRLGDTIRVDWQLARRDEIDAARGTLTFDNRVVNQRGELVVSYGSSLLVGRRPREAR